MSGGQMLPAGAGQGTNGGTTGGGTGGTTGGTAGRGGLSAAGDGGSGGVAGRGQAGKMSGGGTGGDLAGMAGESGAGMSGGNGGTSAAGCRRYATAYTVSSTGKFVTVSCAFERASLAMTCTTDAGDVTVTTWATIEDAVGEYRPIGLRRAAGTEETIAFTSGECRLSRDFHYDGAGRLTALTVTIDPDAPCGTNEATYDTWDADGRPTHGLENGVGGETCVAGEVSFAYDDAARAITTTHSGGTDCVAFTTVLNHDADGLRTTAVNGTSGAVTSTYQTLATGELCE